MDSNSEDNTYFRLYCRFLLFRMNLVVEVDGGYHNEPEQGQYDEGRTYELSELNIKVIRFTNQEILENTDLFCKRFQNT